MQIKRFLCIITLITHEPCNAANIAYDENELAVPERANRSYDFANLESHERLEYFKKKETEDKIKRVWVEYYNCLKVKTVETIKPQMQRLIEGQFTEFYCPVCQKPFQSYDELEWKYGARVLGSDKIELKRLDLTPQMDLSTDKTLKIFNAVADIAGLYACYQNQNVISAYILEVSKYDTIEKVESDSEENEKIIQLDKFKFLVYYKWSKWTQCSSCERIGRKYKYGSCYVTHKLNVTTFRFGGRNFTDIPPINDEDAQTLDDLVRKFQHGVPCSSSYVSNLRLKAILRQPAVKVAVKFCRARCPKPEIFQLFDKSGRVLETANNSAGIFSAYQTLPKPPPDVDRRSLSTDFGSDIVIQCPSTLLNDVPVTWKISDKMIFPEVVGNESSGRFTIDLVNRIHIRKLRLNDDRIYSCWQRNRLVGTVRLNVEKNYKIRFDHHVTLLGLSALTAVCLLVVFKLIAGELNARNV